MFLKICIRCPALTTCNGFVLLDVFLPSPLQSYQLFWFLLTALETISTGPLGMREFSYGEELALTGTALTSLTPPPTEERTQLIPTCAGLCAAC